MRKKMIFCLLISCLCFSACANSESVNDKTSKSVVKENKETKNKKKVKAKNENSESKVDIAKLEQKNYNDVISMENLDQKIIPEASRVSGGSSALMSEDHNYDELEYLYKDSSDILYGSIDDISYFAADGLAFTKAKVTVLRNAKGNHAEGSSVDVIFREGIVSAEQLLNSCSEEDREYRKNNEFFNMSNEELSQKMVVTRSANPLHKVGNESLFFLEPSKFSVNGSPALAPLGGWMGECVKLPNNKLMRITPLVGDTSETGLLKTIQSPYDDNGRFDKLAQMTGGSDLETALNAIPKS